ncbi:MAG: hypothetical protein NXI30_08925 [bacterium]|nr:hypothetical protein [bacterium]
MAETKNAEWTADSMYALGVRHATAEAEGDLEATMATLVDEPVYEFWPMGKRMIGTDAVLRYYEHLVSDFMPSQIGYEMISETVSAEALSQEFVIELRGEDGAPETHRVLGVLYAAQDGSGLMGGERIWGSDEFLRRMIGPIWDELETIEA